MFSPIVLRHSWFYLVIFNGSHGMKTLYHFQLMVLYAWFREALTYIRREPPSFSLVGNQVERTS